MGHQICTLLDHMAIIMRIHPIITLQLCPACQGTDRHLSTIHIETPEIGCHLSLGLLNHNIVEIYKKWNTLKAHGLSNASFVVF